MSRRDRFSLEQGCFLLETSLRDVIVLPRLNRGLKPTANDQTSLRDESTLAGCTDPGGVSGWLFKEI